MTLPASRPRSPGAVRAPALVAVVLAGGLLGAGCTTGDGLEADTARIRAPGSSATLDVDGCGRDGDVIVLGASSPTVLLQLLLVVDGDEVDRDASAVTVTLGARGTLGAGDADRIGAAAGSVGTIERASVRGDRIEVDAEALVVDGSAVEPGRLEVRARCTAEPLDEARGG